MIRRALKKDISEISRLMRESIAQPWSAAALEYALSNVGNDFYVYDDGGIVGFICVENVIDEGCISMIVVDEKRRRQGIARALAERALGESKMLGIYLEVNERNAPAIALYESLGFRKVGIRKKYYGEDSAIIMRKERSI